MPSSLIFAALAAAWLVVLVPMIAKRRQEVVRTAESALASRVLNRQRTHCAAPQYGQEVPMMSERIAERELTPDERRYRPGRGGYDPEAAALAARARYLFRQRVVFGLLAGAVATVVLALAVSSLFWWIHGGLDGALVGYLAYLRRQVRIEEAVRDRRAARMAGSRTRAVPVADASDQDVTSPDGQPSDEQRGTEPPMYEQRRAEPPPDQGSPDVPTPEGEQLPLRPPAPPLRPHPTAVALDLDDEDPLFDELDPAFEPRYRRAAGE